jgi:hypothetical protein
VCAQLPLLASGRGNRDADGLTHGVGAENRNGNIKGGTMSLGRTAACLLAIIMVAGSAGAMDLTLDAVTRATELNPSVGDVSALTDGRTYATDQEAPTFGWDVAGLLAVMWPEPIMLERVRVYLGYMDRYAVYAFLGGSYSTTGQRIGVETPAFSREGLGHDEEGWVDIVISGAEPIDNIGIQFSGGAALYEIQFIGPDATVIEPASLGFIKRRHAQ